MFEKILGRNYKYWYLACNAFKSATSYRVSNMAWLGSRVLTLLITIYIWKLTSEAGSNLIGFGEIFTYYIIGGIFSINNNIHYNISQAIKNGSFTVRLLRPFPVWLDAIIVDFGWQSFTLLVETVFLIILGIFGFKFLIFSSFFNLFLALFAFLIGVFIRIYINLIVGMGAFFTTEIFGLIDMLSTVTWFFSGKAIPLRLVSNFLSFTPFAFIYFLPMEIYFGKFTLNNVFWVYGGGIFALIILHIITTIIWKAGLKRNEAIGL